MDNVTQNRRIYCAGPMRSRPCFGFPAFDKARDELTALGHDVVSPADLDRAHGFDAMMMPADTDWSVVPPDMDIDAIMARDLEALRTCDTIYMLRGWRASSGARQEFEEAQRCGLEVWYEDESDEAYSIAPVAVPASTQVEELTPVAWGADIPFAPQVAVLPPANGETRITDALTGGQKGSKMARYDLIPAKALDELATHYGVGSLKYADRNWERGYKWSLSFAACMRHLWAFWRGEDIDKETGTKHVIAAAWHCFVMATFLETRRSHDDRPKAEVPQ